MPSPSSHDSPTNARVGSVTHGLIKMVFCFYRLFASRTDSGVRIPASLFSISIPAHMREIQ